MENMNDSESIFDLLNGEAKFLPKSIVDLIRYEEKYIACSRLNDSSKKGAYYQLTCKVVQEIELHFYKINPKAKAPIPGDLFSRAQDMYSNLMKKLNEKKDGGILVERVRL